MYIDARNKVFSHVDRLAAWQQGDAPSPVTVEWDLTNVCSLACGGAGGGCHFAHTHVGGPFALKNRIKPPLYGDTGRLADIELVFRGLSQMAEAGVQAIVWSGGGEPTLHPDWASAIQFGRVCGLKQGLYTLGGHLTEDTARMAGLSLDWVVVSLDAPDAESYAKEKGVPAKRFDDACAGVRLLAEQPDLVVGVSFLLHAENWTRTAEMLELGRSLGATYVTFRPTIAFAPHAAAVCPVDRSWVTEALATLWELHAEADVEIDPDRFVEYRDWTGHGYSACYGIRLVTQVTPDGRVWVCPNRRGFAGSSLGSLADESFVDIWKRHPRQWNVGQDCRVMCRLHLVNQTLATVLAPRAHAEFV